MEPWRAVGAFLGLAFVAPTLAGQAAAADRVVVAVPAVAAGRVTPLLREWFGDTVAVQAVAAMGSERLAAPCVLLLWDEWTLARLAAVGALGSMPAPEDGNAARQGGVFVLPFGCDHGIAVDTRVLAAVAAPRSWEDLALHPDLHDRLGLVGPEVDGSPWLLAMQQRLLRGDREDAGVALWTTLDARAGTLATSYETMLADLTGGRLAAAIGPGWVLDEAVVRASGRLRLEPLAAPRRTRLGIAVAAGSVGPHLSVARRLAGSTSVDAVAEILGLAAADGAAAPLESDVARRWWLRFERDVRGRGRGAERLADLLDMLFGVLFLVCAWFLWRSLRSANPPPA